MLKTQPMMEPLETGYLGNQVRRSRSQGRTSPPMARRVWEQRIRLLIFAVNGMNVFAVGLLIQVLLIRFAGLGYVTSYVLQTLASIQLSFMLSRFLTWRDRDVAILPALARFNMQQFAVTGLGMAGYACLEWLGMNYIVANVVVTGVLVPVSFLSSHKWSLAGYVGKAQPSLATGNVAVSSPAITSRKPFAERSITPKVLKRLVVFFTSLIALVWTGYIFGAKLLPIVLVMACLFNLAVGTLEAFWRFYTLRYPEAAEQLAWPHPIRPGEERISFTSIICALDEADVIGATFKGSLCADSSSPSDNCLARDHDTPTIRAVQYFQWAHPGAIDVIIGNYEVPGKHAQLNGALPYCTGEIYRTH